MGKKRFWSVFLTFCLLFTMFPMQNLSLKKAKAEGTYDEPEHVQIYLRMDETWSETYYGYQGTSSMSWMSNNGKVTYDKIVDGNQVSFRFTAKEYGSADFQYGLIPSGDTAEEHVRWIQFNIRVITENYVIPTENPNPTPLKEVGDTPDVSFGLHLSQSNQSGNIYIRNTYGQGIDTVNEDGTNGIGMSQVIDGDYYKFTFQAEKSATPGEKRVWLKRYKNASHTEYELLCMHVTFGEGYAHAAEELMKLRTPVEVTGTIHIGELKRFEFPKKLTEAGFDLNQIFGTANMPTILAQPEEMDDDHIVYRGFEEGTMTGVYSTFIEGSSEPEPALITHITVLPKDPQTTPVPSDSNGSGTNPSTDSGTDTENNGSDTNTSTAVKTVWLSQTKLFLKKGTSKKISLENAKGTVTWSSANKKIATVSGGKITGKALGSTTITATYNGTKYHCAVTVAKQIYTISNSSLELSKGATKTLYLKNGKKKVKKGVSYQSGDKNIVTISKKGKLKAKNCGAAVVTLTCEKQKCYCYVVVGTSVIKHVAFSKKKMTGTAKKDAALTIGKIDSAGYSLTIPKGTFSKDTKITVTSDGQKLDLTAEGKKYVRLDKPVQIKIKLKKPVSKEDAIYYRGVYYFGDTPYYMDLDEVQLKKGIAQFEMDHFSVVDALKVARKNLVKNAAYLKAVNDYTVDTQNELAAKAAEAYLNSVLDEMGVTEARGWGDYRSEINSQIGKSADYIALVHAAKNGDMDSFQSTAAELIAKTLCSRLGDRASAAAGALPAAITAASKGDYKGVLKSVMGAVAMKNPYVKALAFYKSLVEAGVDTWYQSGMESAFQAYAGNATQRGCFGYSGNYESGNDEDWARFTGEMRGVYTKYMDQEMSFYKKANEISESEWAEKPDLQKTARAVADAKLRKEFEKRRDKKKYIEKLAAENEAQIAAFYEYGLVFHTDERPSWMSEEDEALAIRRLLNIKDSIEKMFLAAGTTPARAAERADSANVKLYAMLVGKWIEKSWLPGMDDPGAGRIAVRNYIAKEWGIGVKIGDKVSSMEIGESHQFNLYVEDEIISAKWEVSDKEAAKVTDKGLVTAVADGIIKLKATYGKKTHQVEIKIGEGQLELSAVKKTLMTGQSFTLSFQNRNGQALLDTPSWEVSDTKLVSITKQINSVTVKGLKKGTAQVTAVYHGRKYVCTITIKQTIQLNKKSLTLIVGESEKLKLLGMKASKVLWGLKNPNGVVSISDSGKVTAKKKGTAIVIAQVKGKSKQYTCKVTVKKKEPEKKKESVVGTYIGTMTYYDRDLFGNLLQTLTGRAVFHVKKASEDEVLYYGYKYTGKEYYVSVTMNKTERIKGFYDNTSSGAIVTGTDTSISYSKGGNTISVGGGSISWTSYLVNENDPGNKLISFSAKGKLSKN